MADEKSQANDPQAKTDGEAQPAWAKAFQEMMEQMMAHCGCRPEQMSAMWTTCCGKPAEKTGDRQDL